MYPNQITRQETAAIYTPGGDLVASSILTVRSELKALLHDGVTSLVVDLANVRIIDSAGIGCLVAAHNSLVKIGSSLTVTQASAEIHDLFRSMRLDRHFSIIPQVEQEASLERSEG